MNYSLITKVFEEISATTKRLEITDLLENLFRQTPVNLLDKITYLIQGKLYPDYIGIEIGVAEKLAVRALAMFTKDNQEQVEEIYRKLGDAGSAAETLLQSKAQKTLFTEPLTVERVYTTLDKIARTTGQGSLDLRLKLLGNLLGDATPKEAKYVMRMATGKLRLGIADYTILDAIALAFTRDKNNRVILERAYNISSDLGMVASTLGKEGLEGIKKIKITVGKPIRPMLAERLETVEEVLEKLGGTAAAEYKLDGERLQIHKKAQEVNIFSRRLERITDHYPDVTEIVNQGIKDSSAILEAEVVAINPTSGEYLPFQELMHRRRKYGVSDAVKQYPISLNFFDILYLNNKDCTNKTYRVRRRILEKTISETDRTRIVRNIISSIPKEIEGFMEEAIADGCEGLVIKDLKSIYRAGAREFAWIKLKREYRSELTDTIDLVIIGAFHGRGRRAGGYGTFLLAAYDEETQDFKTVSKIGTGFTDQDLESFSKLVDENKTPTKPRNLDSKMQPDVWCEPKTIIEIIASEITLSPIHTAGLNTIRQDSGLALRFPKYIGRIRNDKRPEDTTSVQRIISMYKKQLKKIEQTTT